MKKTLILASLLAFAVSAQAYAAETATVVPPKKEVCFEKQASAEIHKLQKGADFRKAEFEKRLKLTDEQKAKAKEIRMKGHEAMKPVMEQIRAKRQEIQAVRLSKISVEAQKEKIGKLNGELRELKKQANELRMKNMQEFEAILTKKQLKELKKMKEEGRKKFEKNFKQRQGNSFRPPFGHPPVADHGLAVPPEPVEK